MEKANEPTNERSTKTSSNEQPVTTNSTAKTNQPEMISLEIDDPIAVVWLADDSSLYEWHLGFVDKIENKDTVEVRYFHKASRDNTRWNAPDEETVQTTNTNQILCKLEDIGFMCGNVIRCTIPKMQMKKIKTKFDKYLSHDL